MTKNKKEDNSSLFILTGLFLGLGFRERNSYFFKT